MSTICRHDFVCINMWLAWSIKRTAISYIPPPFRHLEHSPWVWLLLRKVHHTCIFNNLANFRSINLFIEQLPQFTKVVFLYDTFNGTILQRNNRSSLRFLLTDSLWHLNAYHYQLKLDNVIVKIMDSLFCFFKFIELLLFFF